MSKRRISWVAIKGSKKQKEIKDEEIQLNDEEEGIDISKLFGHQDNTTCYTIDNNIYFNDDITSASITTLNKELRSLQQKLLIMQLKMGIEPPPIKLHLTTYGGELTAALSAIACIKSLKVPLHTYVDGYVASAGTLISVCGTKRFIHKHSSMLIQELRSGTQWGKLSNIEEEVENLKRAMNNLIDIYADHTPMSRKKLETILKKDNDWFAAECLKNGLVDEIVD